MRQSCPPVLSEHRHRPHPQASSLKGTVGVCPFTDCSRVLGTLRSLFILALTFPQACFGHITATLSSPFCHFQSASPSHGQQFASQCSGCSPSRPVTGGLLPAHHVLPPTHPGHTLLCDVPHAAPLKAQRHHLCYLLASNDLLLFAFLICIT